MLQIRLNSGFAREKAARATFCGNAKVKSTSGLTRDESQLQLEHDESE